MGRKPWIPLLALLVGAALLSPAAYAGKGGNKGGGGGGDDGSGGSTPDPAIAWVDLAGTSDPLLVVDADGANATVVVPDDAAEPSWAPDGQRLVFRGGWSITTSTLSVVNVDGTGRTDIFDGWTYAGKMAVQPAWSPGTTPLGGERIAFMMGGDVWVIGPDGSGIQNLTNTPNVAEGYPTWSPDGTRLAYRCLYYQDGNRESESIEILDLLAPTGAPLVVATAAAETYVEHFVQLDWARTQDRILYVHHDQNRTVGENASDVWAVDFTTPNAPYRVQLTTTTDASESYPSWGPDDAQIVFARRTGKGKGSGLYVMNANGSGATSIGAKEGTWPDWRR